MQASPRATYREPTNTAPALRVEPQSYSEATKTTAAPPQRALFSGPEKNRSYSGINVPYGYKTDRAFEGHDTMGAFWTSSKPKTERSNKQKYRLMPMLSTLAEVTASKEGDSKGGEKWEEVQGRKRRTPTPPSEKLEREGLKALSNKVEVVKRRVEERSFSP